MAYGGGYVGSHEDMRRIRRQQEQRDKEQKEFEDRKKQSDANVTSAGLRSFGAGVSDVLDNAFKNETVGLVTREEFLTKRQTLKNRLEEEVLRKKREAEARLAQEKAEHRKKKARLAAKTKLSFEGDEDEGGGKDDGGDFEAAPPAGTSGSTHKVSGSAAKMGKDPTVATDFLPDRERERLEEDLRRKLRQEYELRQQLLKREPLEIVYSYWDGQGHRRQLTVKKGDTIAEFLKKVREQLSPSFKELRSISLTDIIYVKEDIILPHELSFYDLIVKKARGKTGPLFHFDVHEDLRMQSDARIEKNESHAGKVVDRRWYARNKHIFPASRWETFDPEKHFGAHLADQ